MLCYARIRHSSERETEREGERERGREEGRRERERERKRKRGARSGSCSDQLLPINTQLSTAIALETLHSKHQTLDTKH